MVVKQIGQKMQKPTEIPKRRNHIWFRCLFLKAAADFNSINTFGARDFVEMIPIHQKYYGQEGIVILLPHQNNILNQ